MTRKSDLHLKIREAIKASGQWYAVMDWEINSAQEFIDKYCQENFTQVAIDLIAQHVVLIQRQFDVFAITLKEE